MPQLDHRNLSRNARRILDNTKCNTTLKLKESNEANKINSHQRSQV